MSGLGVGAGGGAASSGANHPGGDSGNAVSVTDGTPEVPALKPTDLTYAQGDEGTAGVSFSGNGTSNITLTSVVLACPGALPLDGYPTNFFRTNYTSLTQWCDRGCGCAAPGSRPDCQTSDISDKTFTSAAASQICSSSCNCLAGNETAIGQAEDYASIQVNTNALYTQCPNGGFPSGKSAADYRRPNLPVVDIGCQSGNSTLFTLVTVNFSAVAAQTCDQCPGGYGPDPECQHQPIPIPQVGQNCPPPAQPVGTSRKVRRRVDRKVRRTADGHFSLPRARKVQLR